MAKIDTSTIPPDRLDRQDFLQLYNQIDQALRNKKWLSAFSIHEAGHWIYYEKVGITKFSFVGPKILYDPTSDEFSGYPAAVKCDEGMLPKDDFDISAWLFTVAKACAAGGVFSSVLTAAPDVGDVEDRQNFDSIYRSLPNGESLDLDDLWKEAQNSVRMDLRSPAFRQFAWSKAAELQVKLFGAN